MSISNLWRRMPLYLTYLKSMNSNDVNFEIRMYGLGRQAFLFEIRQNQTDGSEYHVLYCVFCCNSKSVFSGMHIFLVCYIR